MKPPVPADASIEQLNHDCFCISLDAAALTGALDTELDNARLSDLIRERNPWVFSAQPVFVGAAHLARIGSVVRAVESVVALPAYREQALAAAPAIARVDSAARGVLYGYDFHLNEGRLGLIEINTNAGGAMLNAMLARAQRSCCAEVSAMVPTRADAEQFEQSLVDMFRQEWALGCTGRPLGSIAIVDEAPKDQYLYAEFLLFQRLLEGAGIRTVIAAPDEFSLRADRLWHGELAIDLVYNRLTDFYLDDPRHQVLRDAWREQWVLLTPHPRAHALFADKRRLTVFSDDAQLQALGVDEPTRQILLESVPHTVLVDAGQPEALWSERRRWFFKPAAGYGSRAAYRGDKLTRRVWNEILAGGYVAQTLVPPGERLIENALHAQAMKYDLRAYVYAGEVLWIAARMYQGQTTNFRTPGGGFAAVFSTADAAGRLRRPADADAGGSDRCRP